MNEDHTDDKPREACGVAGVWGASAPHAVLVRELLIALQHRGQESAGIAVGTGSALVAQHGEGRVPDALPEVSGLPQGPVALGHVRYATHGTREGLAGAQPIVLSDPPIAVAHNGTLVNGHEAGGVTAEGAGRNATDSELLARLVHARLPRSGATAGPKGSRSARDDTVAALHAVLPQLRGAYALVLSDGVRLYGVRDPHGFRPLALGRLGGLWLLASETAAIRGVGAEVVRELEPGEVLSIGPEGVAGSRLEVPGAKTAACLFEYVYFARADSELSGRSVYRARYRAGEELAEYAPPPASAGARSGASARAGATGSGDAATVVVATPETARVAADGYARRAGIPLVQGLLRSATAGRTFIADGQAARERAVRSKLAAVPEAVAGRRVMLVDDSLVRGTTMRSAAQQLRSAGAAEVHLRIASPPYRWPCFYGIDTGRPEELLAARLPISDLADQLACDSVAFLPLERLIAATGGSRENYCTACLTGRYPTDVPAGFRSAPNELPLQPVPVEDSPAAPGTFLSDPTPASSCTADRGEPL